MWRFLREKGRECTSTDANGGVDSHRVEVCVFFSFVCFACGRLCRISAALHANPPTPLRLSLSLNFSNIFLLLFFHIFLTFLSFSTLLPHINSSYSCKCDYFSRFCILPETKQKPEKKWKKISKQEPERERESRRETGEFRKYCLQKSLPYSCRV